MIAKNLALLLSDLGVTKSHSRPHVPDDNPYSEAQFKTMKYRPDYPDRFGALEDSRSWARGFFSWYNFEHHHTGLGLMVPAMVHYGHTDQIQQARQRVLEGAFATHPERFVRGVPTPPTVPDAVWINKPKKRPFRPNRKRGQFSFFADDGNAGRSQDAFDGSMAFNINR